MLSILYFTDIEGLSQQLMARLAMPSPDSNAIFIDDPSSKRTILGQRQIEVRCVYLEDILGKICFRLSFVTRMKLHMETTD